VLLAPVRVCINAARLCQELPLVAGPDGSLAFWLGARPALGFQADGWRSKMMLG